MTIKRNKKPDVDFYKRTFSAEEDFIEQIKFEVVVLAIGTT